MNNESKGWAQGMWPHASKDPEPTEDPEEVWPDSHEIIKRIRTLKNSEHAQHHRQKCHSIISMVKHDKEQIFYEAAIELIKKVTMKMG